MLAGLETKQWLRNDKKTQQRNKTRLFQEVQMGGASKSSDVGMNGKNDKKKLNKETKQDYSRRFIWAEQARTEMSGCPDGYNIGGEIFFHIFNVSCFGFY